MYGVFITFIRIILRILHTCFFALFGRNNVTCYLLFQEIFLFKLIRYKTYNIQNYYTNLLYKTKLIRVGC